MSGNQALDVNSGVFRHADVEITTRASDWYFTVCAIMGVSTLAFVAMSTRLPRTHRVFHYITASITFVACIAYFSMGANLGQVPVAVEFFRPDSAVVGGATTREIFWVRYVDWFVTTPLLLLDLLLTAGLPWPTILMTILVDEVMIVCGLVGALIPTVYKWAYWVFGTVALVFVAWQLVGPGRAHATALGGAVRSTYMSCGVVLVFVWFLYPIAWGLSEGGNVIHPDSEAIFYGILDIIAKPVFGALLIWGHRRIDPAAIGLHVREPGQSLEKGAPVADHSGHHGTLASNGTHNGHTATTTGGVIDNTTATNV